MSNVIEDLSADAIAAETIRHPGAVVWISGYSAAGKTTVGRLVESQLRRDGERTLFLDGDELRSILGSHWGYSREARSDLARVYFRLCSHLASQGCTVVISAVAMYDDARRWLRDNVPGALEIFLDVSEEERRRRDEDTKQIYSQLDSHNDLYDPPTAPDLVVANAGETSPRAAASQIVSLVRERRGAATVDHGREAHWKSYYAVRAAPELPSSFAQVVAEAVDGAPRLLEIGCGNGRDSEFFCSLGWDVTACDPAKTAVDICRDRGIDATFYIGDISAVTPREPFDLVYTRFVLHAMTRAEEGITLARVSDILMPGGRMFIEARSINDPLARRGEVLSSTERIHGHYRRFIILEELLATLAAHGFSVESAEEVAGVSPLGEDNPTVVRVCAVSHPS